MSDYPISPEEQERRQQVLRDLARYREPFPAYGHTAPGRPNGPDMDPATLARLGAEDDARADRYFARKAAEQRAAEADQRTATADAPDYLPDPRANTASAMMALASKGAPTGGKPQPVLGSRYMTNGQLVIPPDALARANAELDAGRAGDIAHERDMMLPSSQQRAKPDVTIAQSSVEKKAPESAADLQQSIDSGGDTPGAQTLMAAPRDTPAALVPREQPIPKPGNTASTDSSLLGATPEERARRAAVVQSEMSAPPAFKAGEVAAEQPEARAALPEHAPSDIAADFYNSVAQNKDVPEEQQKQAAALAEQATKSGVPQRPRGYATATGSPMWNAYASQSFAHTGGDVHSDLMTLASRGGGGGGGGAGGDMDGDTAAGLGMMAFDVLANRGRGLGTLSEYMGKQFITPYEQQKRELDLEHTRAEIDHLRQSAHQMDPMTFQLQMQRLEMQRQQLEQQKATQARIGNHQNWSEQHGNADLARKEHDWYELHNKDSETAQHMRTAALANGIPHSQVDDATASDIARLSPAMNEYLKSTGVIGEARTEQAAATAGASAAAQLPTKNAEATHAAKVQGEARTASLVAARLAPIMATRSMGEAELNQGFDDLIEMANGRAGGAIGTRLLQGVGTITGSRGVLLPQETAYEVAKQMMINAAEKMMTGNGPHDSAVTRLVHALPEYGTAGAAEQLKYIQTELRKLGAVGGAALESVKEGRPPGGQAPTATPGQATVPVGPAPRSGGKRIAPEDFHDLGGVLQ